MAIDLNESVSDIVDGAAGTPPVAPQETATTPGGMSQMEASAPDIDAKDVVEEAKVVYDNLLEEAGAWFSRNGWPVTKSAVPIIIDAWLTYLIVTGKIFSHIPARYKLPLMLAYYYGVLGIHKFTEGFVNEEVAKGNLTQEDADKISKGSKLIEDINPRLIASEALKQIFDDPQAAIADLMTAGLFSKAGDLGRGMGQQLRQFLGMDNPDKEVDDEIYNTGDKNDKKPLFVNPKTGKVSEIAIPGYEPLNRGGMVMPQMPMTQGLLATHPKRMKVRRGLLG